MEFIAIKNDIENGIENGYNYMEYEGKYGIYQYTLILDRNGYDVNGSIVFVFETETHGVFGKISVIKFMKMTELEFYNYCNSVIYYNRIEKE